MTAIAYPALFALFAWWFGTGAILFLDGLPRRTFRWSMAGATVLCAAAVYGIVVSRTDASTMGACAAFAGGLVIWAWLEMTYYMGFVTGPRREPCRPGCAGWAHFGHAVMSSLYHELATIALAAALYAVTRGSPNEVALWTFVVLWWMQISAKLNVFLGVPNVSEEFLPEHLSFLKSFLTKKPMNLLFPVSVTVSIVLATLLVQHAFASDASPLETTTSAILGTLMVLAILEHWFLVLPLRADALWSWSLSSRTTAAEAAPTEVDPCACPQCMTEAHGASSPDMWPARRIADKSYAHKRVAGRLTEATLPHPAQPILARRP